MGAPSLEPLQGALPALALFAVPALLAAVLYLALLARRLRQQANAAIAAMEDEITVRSDTERQLTKLTLSLEERIAERTVAVQERAEELARINAQLAAEVAERARVEDEVRSAKLRFEDLFDNSPDMYVVVDVETRRMLECNQTVVAELGYGRDEILGRPVDELYPEAWRQEAQAAVESLLQHGEVRDAELQLRRKDASTMDVSLNMSAVRDDTGRVLHSRVTWRDITDRKSALEASARQAQELRRSNAELEQFAFVVAHDLQEPLRLVARYTQLLQRRYSGQLDAEADEFIGFAVEGAERMHRMLVDLLVFSQVTALDRREVSSKAVVEEALTRLQGQVHEAGAAIVCGELPRVIANGRELGLVFEHLISNALKFRSDRPPNVEVDASQGQGEWRFSVKDNGIGIEPGHAEHIFLVFKRLNKRRDFTGTGVGLALCKKIIERHGGRIWVESEVGQGARFVFTLPAREAAQAA